MIIRNKNKFLILILALGLIVTSCTTAKEANTDPWYQKGPLYVWNSGTSTYDLITSGGSGGVNIIWKGTLSSAPGSPVDGWAYRNSTDGKSYLRYNGSWAEMNQDGQQGTQGIQGVPGNNGSNGSNGVNGATWYNGTGAPSGGTGVDGDFYLDNSSPNNVYKKITGSWTLQTNIQGNTGATGSQGIQGIQGNPGSNGTNGTNGTNGVDGKTVRNGSGAPSGGLGVDGDFYIDTTANAIYGPKSGGAWGSATNLVGPTGATGPSGPNTVTSATTTNLTGYFYGNGTSVSTNNTFTSPTINSPTITGYATGRAATFVVAAVNATATEKAQADYVCTGTNDQTVLQAAITALPATGGSLRLTEGTYYLSANVTVNKSIKMFGDGISSVVATTVDGINAFEITAGDSSSFSDLRITTTIGSPTGGAAFYVINDVTKLTFRDLIIGPNGTGMYDGFNFVSASYWLIDNSKVYVKHYSITNSNSAYGGDEGDNHITDSLFFADGSDTTTVEHLHWTGGGGLHITGSKFQYGKYALNLKNGANINTGLLEVSNTSIENFGTLGINVDASASGSSFVKVLLSGVEFLTSSGSATALKTNGAVYYLSWVAGSANGNSSATAVVLAGGSLSSFVAVHFDTWSKGFNNTGASNVTVGFSTFNSVTTPFTGTIAHFHNIGGGD